MNITLLLVTGKVYIMMSLKVNYVSHKARTMIKGCLFAPHIGF